MTAEVVGAAASAVEFVWPKRSSAAAPAVGTEKAAYVEKVVAAPVTLRTVPRQPATNEVAVVGQFTESPIVSALAPAADHWATVMSVHALAPASEEDPRGQGNCKAEDVPSGQ